MKSELETLSVICWTNAKLGNHTRIPTPDIKHNICHLCDILDLIVKDWMREVDPIQRQYDLAVNDNARLLVTLEAFKVLPPHLLKALFSYVMFVVALDNAYQALYSELNQLNKKLFFRIKHPRPPAVTHYIHKIRRIRNIAIAHMGSKNSGTANSIAGLRWAPFSLSTSTGQPFKIEEFAFGGFRINVHDSKTGKMTTSDDFEVKGITELNANAESYLKDWDQTCCGFLAAICGVLPKSFGDDEFTVFP